MCRRLNWFIVALISALVCDLTGFQKLSSYFHKARNERGGTRLPEFPRTRPWGSSNYQKAVGVCTALPEGNAQGLRGVVLWGPPRNIKLNTGSSGCSRARVGLQSTDQPRLMDLTHRGLAELQAEFRRPGLLVLDKPLPLHSMKRRNEHMPGQMPPPWQQTQAPPAPRPPAEKVHPEHAWACRWWSPKPGEGFEWGGMGSQLFLWTPQNKGLKCREQGAKDCRGN